MGQLEGKSALVTGGSRGTGSVIAERFVGEGATVVIGDILDAEGERVAARLGERATYRHLDVTSEDDWAGAVAATAEVGGSVDILVNNAAVLHLGTVATTSAETYRRVLDVNTVGPYLGIRAVLDAMSASGGGSIVNIASIDGLVGMNAITAYCASKWGLRGLTRAAALELGRSGIRVNAVCPAGGNPEMYAPWYDRLAAIGDMMGDYGEDRAIPGPVALEAIADAVIWLASDASASTTGADLPVDGGHHAGDFLAGLNRL